MNAAIGLLVVGVVVVSFLLLRFRASPDRQPTTTAKWDPNDVTGSLSLVLTEVENAAASAVGWYWKEKGPKARASRVIQAASVALTVAAGLLPVVIELYFTEGASPEGTGLWSTVLVGAAAGLLGLDRAFGYSSAWARYVLAATEISRLLAAFRMDWLATTAAASNPPSAADITALLQKAKEFRVAVEAVVVQETKEWATEFQNNLAQLERDVKAQLETLKTKVEQQRKEREAATQPGAIEATLTNADKLKDFTFFVTLEGSEGDVVKNEKVIGGHTWTKRGLKPDQYELTISADTVATATQASARITQETIVTVKSDEVAKPSVTLSGV